jgi:hypothetical protein
MPSRRGQEVPEMADAIDSTLAGGDDTVASRISADTASRDGSTPDGVARLAAHLLELDLDARSLEILMAALTVESCDQVDLPDD